MKNCHTLLQKVEIDCSLSFFFFVFKKYNNKKSMESMAIFRQKCSKVLILMENVTATLCQKGLKKCGKSMAIATLFTM
jgi:hypothetical protein